ncbi:SPFH domain-containing protein [Criibacterium bergeronii]|uniref:SPFH domain-containing protein n=1 Tax=Criibacterium bergeronii TaxID=1871336 RepID=A0A371IP15_9FIRM|nr:SPFH domain-containing protein [uncultured Criibacterium sp.]MBS6062477.1 SPFH domain-containing protein [Peptostreptococcaceae bacterium]RDY22225.1 SPFH domain-containing protein [Criibacterium bergeronii]
MEVQNDVKEKILLEKSNGAFMAIFLIITFIATIAIFFLGINYESGYLILLSLLLLPIEMVSLAGFKVLGPQESLVYTLFGKYTGTLKGDGFYYINPFSTAVNPAAKTELGQSSDVKTSTNVLSSAANTTSVIKSKKISLKVMTLNNSKQKVNDALGNPVDIGVAVMWTVVDTAKAVFNVDNFKEYLSLQTDASVRNIVKIYPYDVAPNIDTTGDGNPDDGSLRSSTTVVAERIKQEIQNRVDFAGLKILDARITYLSYSPEIAQAMLKRQQAAAVVDARATIVDGAVGMVQMALEKIKENKIVDLDEERKAAMVSNLLVVLCSNNEVSPVVNSGSLY